MIIKHKLIMTIYSLKTLNRPLLNEKIKYFIYNTKHFRQSDI